MLSISSPHLVHVIHILPDIILLTLRIIYFARYWLVNARPPNSIKFVSPFSSEYAPACTANILIPPEEKSIKPFTPFEHFDCCVNPAMRS
jgi:hypothetical protein